MFRFLLKAICFLLALIVLAILTIVIIIYTRPKPALPSKDWLRVTNVASSNKDPPKINIFEAEWSQSYNLAAYCPKPEIEAWSCYWCNYKKDFTPPRLTHVRVIYNESTDELAYVGMSEEAKRLQVVFRPAMATGSSLMHLVSFHKIFPYPDQPTAYVHDGFQSTWMSLKPGVVAAIEERRKLCPACKLKVSGFSLGAAVATVAAVDLWRDGYRDFETTVMGSLRPGNVDFGRYLGSLQGLNFHSIVNRGDLATMLGRYDDGWRHVPRQVYMNGTLYRECDPTAYGTHEDPTCSYGDTFWSNFDGQAHTHYLHLNVYNGNEKNCTVFLRGIEADTFSPTRNAQRPEREEA